MTDGPDFEIVDHTPAEFVSLTDALLRREWTDEEFEIGDAEVLPLNGLWALSPSTWDPEEPVADWTGHPAVRWAEDYRDALIASWGPPSAFAPRIDSETGDPDGVIDIIFTTLGIEDALEWKHDDRHVLLTLRWVDEPGASRFDQLLLIVPEVVYSGGRATIISAEASIEPRLFHGEQLAELHRRAALMAYVGGRGEETVLTPGDDEASATRCSYRIDACTWAHWIFTSDSRALLLILDTTTHGLLDPGDEGGDPEAAIAQLQSLYYGVPDDLLDLMSRPASSVEGQVSTVDGFPVNGRVLPRISGAFWFDGDDWHNSPGLIAYANRHNVGFDDVGFDNAVRRPLRLGGDFQPEHLLIPGHVNLADADEVARALTFFETAFENSPHPEGTSPEGLIRLGPAIPPHEAAAILDDIETTATDWWDTGLETYEKSLSPFTMVGRPFESFGRRELMAHLGNAEEWTADIFGEWMESLIEAATERWGQPFRIEAHETETGRPIRIPSARPLRGNGFASAPAWWVNGLVVSFNHGSPPQLDMAPDGWHLPGTRPGPIALAYIYPADAVIDPIRGTGVDELRYRVHCVAALQDVRSQTVTWNSTPIGYRANDPGKSRELFDHTTAEAVRWVLPAPRLARAPAPEAVPDGSSDPDTAVVDSGYHAWHFTHDNRALLITWSESSPFNVFAGTGAAREGSADSDEWATAFERQAALYAGAPEDLLTLVADQPESPGMLSVSDDAGHTLAAATGVLWYDGLDWIVPTGLLTAVHEHLDNAEVSDDAVDARTGAPMTPANVLIGGSDGLRTAAFVLAAGNRFDSTLLLDDPHYSTIVFGRVPHPDEVSRALNSYGTVENVVMYGSLEGFLNVRVHATDFDRLVPAALSNPDPRSRRELFLWLLGSGASATAQYSRSTNLTILLDNEVLEPESDAILVKELITRGAAQMVNTVAPRVRGGGHPLVQLCDRDLDDEDLAPLYQAFFCAVRSTVDGSDFATLDLGAFLGVDRPLGPNGQTVAEYVAAGRFPHSRDRRALLEHISRCRVDMTRAWKE